MNAKTLQKTPFAPERLSSNAVLYRRLDYCKIAGISESKEKRDRLLGTGCPFIRLGRLIRYRPSDVQDYLERHRHHYNPALHAREGR